MVHITQILSKVSHDRERLTHKENWYKVQNFGHYSSEAVEDQQTTSSIKGCNTGRDAIGWDWLIWHSAQTPHKCHALSFSE